MNAIVWIPSEQVEGEMVRLMAHGAMIKYIPQGYVYSRTEIFDVDDYVILVDVDELEGE